MHTSEHREIESAPAALPRRATFVAILIAVWAVPAILATIETYTFNRLNGRPFAILPIAIRESAMWATYAALTPLMLRLADRFPLTSPPLARKLVFHFSVATALGVIAAGVATLATRLVQSQLIEMRTLSTPRVFLSWFLGSLPVAVVSYFAVVGVAHALRYFTESQRRREHALLLETQLADARLSALQGRLHPHFLYNTLNAVTVLIRDGDVAKSTRMLELLGEILRRVLDKSMPQIIPLRSELDLLRQYLEIEQVRFSDRLCVHVDAEPDALDVDVPAFVLQPLAENAIRHAVARTSRIVTLRIVAGLTTTASYDPVLELRVEDDGPGLTEGWQARKLDRTGLSATAARLDTIFGRAASLEIAQRAGDGVVSTLRIPMTKAHLPAFTRVREERSLASPQLADSRVAMQHAGVV